MRTMKIYILLITVFLCGFSATAWAAAETEIGVSVPLGKSAVPEGAAENYAIFHTDTLILEATAYEKNDGLYMEMKLTNPQESAFSVEHRTGQVYDFVILDDKDKQLYRWSDQMAFTQAFTTSSIPAHTSVTYTAEIPKKEYQKIKKQAAAIRMYLTDTNYWAGLRVPKNGAHASASPITLHGSIAIGSGGHYHDW